MDYQALPLFSKLFYLKKLNIDTKRIISRIQEPFIESGYQKENNVENIAGASKSKTVSKTVSKNTISLRLKAL